MSVLPLVSVIVPTFKRADKIQRAVDSILNQDYQEIEVLIVNDNNKGSKEDKDTLNHLEKYSDDKRVRIVRTSGALGGGAARNYGCRQAYGSYLAFLDDDDKYLPGKISTQLQFMLDNSLDMSFQDVEWVDEQEQLVEYRKLDHVKDFTKEGLLRAHVLTPIAPTSIYMLTKELFDKTEGFGEVKVGQDWILMLRCIETGAKIGYLPGSWVHQFLYEGDRLSLGTNKIEGENALFEIKQRYFSLLDPAERRFAKFRHYAVLAFACKRSHRMLESAQYFAQAFATSPKAFFSEGLKFLSSKKGA